MHRHPIGLLVLAAMLVIGTGAGGSQPMYQPKPTPIPQGVDPDDATKAVREVLVGRNWTIEPTKDSEDGRTLTANLTVEEHELKLEIRVDGKQISLAYVDSVEMGYKLQKGMPHIHPRYTQWLRNIERDLTERLRALTP